jgi:ribonuclease Z
VVTHELLAEQVRKSCCSATYSWDVRVGFYIQELNIMLDAGPVTHKNPDHIFITHNHVDHVAGLPFSMIRSDDSHIFNVYGPAAAEKHIQKYVSAMFELNDLSEVPYDPTSDRYSYIGFREPVSITLSLKRNLYEVDVVICDHTVPTVSYCFKEIRTKLKEDYIGLSGREVKSLRENGVEITESKKHKRFAYICDTSIKVLTDFPDILLYPIVFIECSFLYPDDLAQAETTKHIHWDQLLPFIISNRDTLFVLMHFSLRYREEDILRFILKKQDEIGLSNIKIWAGDTNIENSSNILCQECKIVR